MTLRYKSRMFLLASVSAIALAAASPEVRAADMPAPVIAKAPVVKAPASETNCFLEGAGFWTGGDQLYFLGIEPFKARSGWEGAIGCDHRFAASPWHVSAQFRYGAAKGRSKSFGYYTGTGESGVAASGTIKHKEHHWVADFAVGRDIGIGAGKAQAKLGLRIAEINAKTSLTGSYSYFTSGGPTAAGGFSIIQRSKFLGIGPRAALEGNLPLSGAWSIDYMGGIAVLFGNRKLDITADLGVISASFSSHSSGAVFNADASAGLSYAFTPNFKLTAGYRFDGYWNALRTLDSNGNIVNADRYFHGPFARATMRF